MLKTKDQDLSALKLQEFTAHNHKVFYDPSIPPE
jgi:Reverse transcriptase (RNA-dependent DNA polymerase)